MVNKYNPNEKNNPWAEKNDWQQDYYDAVYERWLKRTKSIGKNAILSKGTLEINHIKEFNNA